VDNRRAWDVANQKYVGESDAVLAWGLADDGGTLLAIERELLHDVLAAGGDVVHLQSGNAADDFGLLAEGASSVIGVDFSNVVVATAQARSAEVGAAATYVVGDALAVPLRAGCADLVYTGKGALMWLSDLGVWATEVQRLLRPGGACFVYEAHPMAAVWTGDADEPRLVPSVDYFGGTRINTSFPASAIARFGDADTPDAVEHQWPLSTILQSLVDAGLALAQVGEHPEPFWRPADGSPAAAAWKGTLPNSVSILAVRAAGR
jgi:SAM-dependent methyltransferase